MTKPFGLASLLLVSSALVAPSVAVAQNTAGDVATGTVPTAPDSTATDAVDPTPAPPQAEEQADVSLPGVSNDIIVVGRRTRDIARTTSQVVSVLSSADIARTGEGNIAGALGRVTGLSVVGNGFVYVRGLGDRYSLALLNGSPLPSPEPLKRVVPLDLFPTSVVSSSLVQKSYSANFPGEFGGGVINLTTKAIPKETTLTLSGSLAGDSETTGQLGYTYYGSKSDWTGFDNGSRDLPPALVGYLNSGQRISEGGVDTQAIAGQLVNGRNALIQRNKHLPPNWSAAITGTTSLELGDDASLGIIATAGYSNKWRTRDTLQQTANSVDLSSKELDFQRVITDDRIVANGLLGFGLEFGDNKVRWTNLYIRDTLKQARLGVGTRATSGSATLQQQDTAWYERQLIDTQLVGELKLTDALSLDLRGAFANSKRQAPDEFSFEYARSNDPNDPYGAYFINTLGANQRGGSASVSYSDLNENLWSGGLDLSYKVTPDISATVGYAVTDTKRRTEVRDFQFRAPSDFPTAIGLFRPDYLLQPSIIDFYKINLIDTNEANPVFIGKLLTNAGYGQVQADITSKLNLNLGVRFEKARQTVTPLQVFTTPSASLANASLRRDYWLPAATVTWKFNPDMQVRLNASKTIARPQFRELIYQLYFDPDNNREFRGNPLLTDSQLYNAEARYEWYFAPEQRIAVAAFFKRIDNPIETFASFSDNTVISSFANAPKANLYGVEVEAQKFFPLDTISDAPFWASRKFVAIANYSYTKSKLKVSANDPVAVFASSATKATDYFRDGAPLTGQSDHIVNLQLGMEDKDTLSQQTILFSYASKRVTSRGAALQPDIIEEPGIQLDFVARQGIRIRDIETELKLEVRNITGTKYKEYQQNGENRIFYNLYDRGTIATLGLSVNF
ncbi:TonB-dependent receptor [soil metagenome]